VDAEVESLPVRKFWKECVRRRLAANGTRADRRQLVVSAPAPAPAPAPAAPAPAGTCEPKIAPGAPCTEEIRVTAARLDTKNNKDWAEAGSTQRCCANDATKGCATDNSCGGLVGKDAHGCLTHGSLLPGTPPVPLACNVAGAVLHPARAAAHKRRLAEAPAALGPGEWWSPSAADAAAAKEDDGADPNAMPARPAGGPCYQVQRARLAGGCVHSMTRPREESRLDRTALTRAGACQDDAGSKLGVGGQQAAEASLTKEESVQACLNPACRCARLAQPGRP
jgi:hypothetical protein